MKKALLELIKLKVNYGGARTIKDLSMSLPEGSIICLIGANGAGKTTTLRTISGLKRPRSGEIVYKGEDITQTPCSKILAEGIVHVPQEGRIFSDMTVYENLKMGAYLRKEKVEVIKDLETVYEYFPILKIRARLKAGSLSGGERQMLAIGRGLMSKPKILLMDEPTSGLAPKLVRRIGQIINRMNQAGISILLVEQNAELALHLAKYGYVMERGRISLKGPTHDLLENEQVKQAYLGVHH
jgi:branched-chain amino acid transport system ATP-binding protein